MRVHRQSSGTLNAQMRDMAMRRIMASLRQNGGNVSRTARELGLSRSALHARLGRWDQDASESDLPDVCAFDVVSPFGGTRLRMSTHDAIQVALEDGEGHHEVVPTWKFEMWLQCGYVKLEAHSS